MTRASWWQNLAGFAAVTVGCILLALAGVHHEQVAPLVGYGGGLVIGLASLVLSLRWLAHRWTVRPPMTQHLRDLPLTIYKQLENP